MNTLAQSTDDLSISYQALRQGMLGFLNKHLGDQTLAEDMLQEVFLAALKANEKGNSPQNIAAWLYKIAKNKIIDFYRTKRPMQALPENLMAESSDPTFSEKTLLSCLRPMIEQLPSISKKTLLDVYFNGKSMQNIADAEKLPISTVKNRASRGRQLLKKNLLACCHIEISKNGHVMDCHQPMSESDCQTKNC